MDTSPVANANAESEKRVSGKFCAPDANLIFVSSDSIVFKIHSTSISKLTTMGFPDVSDHIAVGSEPIHLSEPEDVLELLFQFIEPPDESQNCRQPSVLNLDPIIFFGLAEAAKKYIVYGAMNICLAHMLYMVDTHPLEVLNHCTKHGYGDHVDRAAELSISHSLDEVAVKLTAPGLLPRWLIYYNKWRAAGAKAVLQLEKIAEADRCVLWAGLAFIYGRELAKNPLYIAKRPLDTLPSNISSLKCNSSKKCSCSDIPNAFPVWFSTLNRTVDTKFSSITL